ncbi:MAG TPA: protein kinase [Actinomycetota bacterium]|nr:protein kinase [Actinomycetota bacterium]
METRPAGERLAGRYVLEEPIAAGGMATVWRARDEVLARPVAVKILREDLAESEAFRERFHREAVAAARLSHPRIVAVYDTGGTGDTSFIVMELFDGTSLADVLRNGPLKPRRAAQIVVAALEGLGYAHGEGLVHRDVKPANILVAGDGRVKVTDFGVAKAAFDDHDLTSTGKVLGTVRYLSPEQVEGGTADARSDVYAAGVVLYEALTGRPPFQAENDLATAMLRLRQDPMPPGAVRAGIPRALEAVTMRALARRPEDRYASAEEMRLDLVRALGPGGHPVTTEIRPSAPPPPRGVEHDREPGMFRTWMLVPLIAVLVAAALIVVGLVLGRLEIGGPLGVRPAENAGNGNGTVSIRPATIVDFDPPPGDLHENTQDVPLVADGDPATVWRTEGYNSADLGRLKPGVGLLFDLGAQRSVSRVVVTSPLPGWTFEIRAADVQGAVLQGSPKASLTAGDKVQADAEFEARYVLIWITRLAPSEDRFRAEISEVRFLGPEA